MRDWTTQRFRAGESPFFPLCYTLYAILFLDEPTTGLDVMHARHVRQMIAGLKDEGVTAFLTTHYLEEAERLCDRIALIVEGRIIILDTVHGLKAAAQDTTMVEVTLSDETGHMETKRLEGVSDLAKSVSAVLAQAQAEGRRVVAVNTIRPTLEDAFVKLTGLHAEALAETGEKGQRNAGG